MAVVRKTVLAVAPHTETRREICSQLQRASFEVVAALTTDDAYALLQEHPEIDLLVADLLAPGTFDAVALFEEARTLRENLQLLLTTDLDRFARTKGKNRRDEGSPMVKVIQTLLEST